MSSPRNLDLSTMRSLIAIVEAGTMTRAASKVNLTQSALSMQMKKLESTLGLPIFERTANGLNPTSACEQLLQYARQLISLNDEAWSRLTAPDYSGSITLGIPSDLIGPHMPKVLSEFNRDFPRAKVTIVTASSGELLKLFDAGKHDLILTTEPAPRKGATVLNTCALVWTGAEKATAWTQRPLPVAFCKSCAFLKPSVDALNDAGINWSLSIDTQDDRAIDAMVVADLCIGSELEGYLQPGRVAIEHKGQLPQLPDCNIALYQQSNSRNEITNALRSYLQAAYS